MATYNATQKQRRRLKLNGAVMLWVLIVTMMIITMGLSMMSLTLHGLRTTRRIQDSTLAFNLAESSAEKAVRWLKDQGSPPAGTTTIDPFGGVQTLDPGTYSAQVIPDPGNPGAILKAYTITGTGTVDHLVEHVTLYVRQQSFGKYAYFTDQEVSAVSGGAIWFQSSDRIRGPAHSNNKSGSNFQVDWTTASSANPIFQDAVTSVASSINYSPSSPNTEANFTKIYKAGSRGYKLGVNQIPLPSSSSAQQIAAWGSSAGFPSTSGVYVPSNGGIYIVGDSSMVAKTDASGNQQFVITQGTKVTTVTYMLGSNQVKYQLVNNGSPGPTNTVVGLGTQVIYTTGNITALSGTIGNNRVDNTTHTILNRNAYTIATDMNNGKNITLNGTLKYATAPTAGLSYSDPANINTGTLGLIGRNVTIAAGSPTTMQIDAVILAGSSSTTDGSFSVADYNSKQPTGTLTVTGGIIQKARGPVGTISNGALNTGYAKNYLYDSRLADAPPPYFPTTGLYDRLSWQRLAPTAG